MDTRTPALVYCDGAFNTPSGKTAHGLTRFTRRYLVRGILDATYAGQDAGQVLDGKPNGIPIWQNLDEALAATTQAGHSITHFVIGLAPDGGRLPAAARETVKSAIQHGLHIDSGLHDFLSDDPAIAALAQAHQVQIRDVRKPPSRDALHFFSGKIEEVDALKIAVLGTDSAVGKRTTAWLIVQGFEAAGYRAELIGTGQTAWMQGAPYSIVLDSLINDFVAGELEHATWQAWHDRKPDVLVVEGQGSLMNPAYPGGFEILAATRPDIVVMQHAPTRKEYDGFPGYPLHPLAHQIEMVTKLSGKPVVAVTVNHEGLTAVQIPYVCEALSQAVGVPAFDVLADGPEALIAVLRPYLDRA